jgi:hypothetical protein
MIQFMRGIIQQQIPLLKGEGDPKGRVRGTVERLFLYPSPGPLARATLSLQEWDDSFGFWIQSVASTPRTRFMNVHTV